MTAEGGQMSLSSFKEQFDDQLTCSVCLDQYTNPKTLPCLHSFCLHCIEQVPMQKKDEKYYINCPTCRVDHLLPQGGANSLPNAFHINSLLDLREKLVSIKIVTPILSTYCKATLEVLPCTVKQPSSATLTLHSHDGSPFALPPSLISSTLSSPGNKHSVKCPITQTQPGKYNITFTPSTRNEQLIVQVGGVDVPDSPFTLRVISTPQTRGEPVNTITGLKGPWGIAVCDNGDIVVAEWGEQCIRILNEEGEKVKTFGHFNYPCGVAVSIDGHILVTDNHRLQKLTTDGVCVKSVGSKKSGCGQLQLDFPLCIAVHPTTGQIFVADSGNDRIQVFNNDLTFSHTISPTQLSLSPQFNRPRDIAIDKEGYLYIVDEHNDFIFKISASNRECMKKIIFPPDQKMFHPAFLTVHNNVVYLYVTENGNYSECNKDTILVFDTEGKFQQSFGVNAIMKYPQSMSTDTLGNLYISDMDSNRIIVI